MRDPLLPPPPHALAGVELGAVLGVGNEVVLRVLSHLRANLIVSWKLEKYSLKHIQYVFKCPKISVQKYL